MYCFNRMHNINLNKINDSPYSVQSNYINETSLVVINNNRLVRQICTNYLIFKRSVCFLLKITNDYDF